jgi:hypothetical protein
VVSSSEIRSTFAPLKDAANSAAVAGAGRATSAARTASAWSCRLLGQAAADGALALPWGRRRQRQVALDLRPLTAGVLELGPQPAHDAAALFPGALGVERHQPAKDLLVAQLRRPAVGVGDGGVEVVVDLPQHQHQPLLVDLAVTVEGTLAYSAAILVRKMRSDLQ